MAPTASLKQALIDCLELEFCHKEEAQPIEEFTISLADFFRESWEILEPSTKLEWNWHMEAICFHVENLFYDWVMHRQDPSYKQRARNLLVNVPPGSSKSRIVAVNAPAWIWSQYPSFRMLFLSSNPRVALRDSMLCRDLIESDWYQEKFKPTWSLRDDQNNKSSYWNTAGGVRSAAGFNSRITGDRADCISWDDPHDASEVNSAVIRQGVLDRWDNAIRNRVNDLRSSIRIGIMQRLHADDLSGHVLASGEWDHLCIPQEFDHDRPPTAFGWKDPRTQKGELMHPTRFPESVLQDERKALGSAGYAGQHQQNPVPDGGNIFKMLDWMIYTELPRIDRWLLSVDCSFKKTATSDFVAVTALAQQANVASVMKLVRDPKTGETIQKRVQLSNYYVPGIWHGKAGIVDTQNAIREMWQKFPQAGITLIEDKANGSAILEQLGLTHSGLEPFEPGGESKTSRAWSIQPIHERGGLFLPAVDWAVPQIRALGKTEISLREYWEIYPPKHQSTAEHAPVPEWAKGIIDEFSAFPVGEHDDRVDSIDQGIIYCEANQITRIEFKSTGKRVSHSIGY